MLTFGPIPSRRLGYSLGINIIPPKHCPYACVYCQVGPTNPMTIQRREFYPPDEVIASVREGLNQAHQSGSQVDYLTFVADGEPTLDLNLLEEIRGIKALGCPVAVISNSSLIWVPEVRLALMEADWVSLKVDAVDPAAWRRVDRPHGRLELKKILSGIEEFSREYPGFLVTETMLVSGQNDDREVLDELGKYLEKISPRVAYLSVPTRPPAESWVTPPPESVLNLAYAALAKRVKRVEFLAAFEGTDFKSLGEVEDDILRITSVHPLREDAAQTLLEEARADRGVLEKLIKGGQLARVEYGGKFFYLRRFS